MKNNFAGRLKIAMAGDTNAGAAEKGGVSEGSIRGYLAGRSIPGLETAFALSQAYRVSLDWLAGGEDRQPEALGVRENADEMRLLVEAGRKATQRNFHLRKIVEWIDEYYGADEDQAFIFFEAMKRDWESFQAFIERSLPPLKSGPGREGVTEVPAPEKNSNCHQAGG